MDKYNLSREEGFAQYDRYIGQLREEIRELYWLYNFFFIFESALVSAIFVGRINEPYLFFTQIIGFLVAFYWCWVVIKKKLWRDDWLDKIFDIEKKLDITDSFKMWPQDQSSFWCGRNGLWKLLILLPKGFVVVWITLLLAHYYPLLCRVL